MSTCSQRTFKWTEQQFTLKQLVAQYRHLLPFPVLVTQDCTQRKEPKISPCCGQVNRRLFPLVKLSVELPSFVSILHLCAVVLLSVFNTPGTVYTFKLVEVRKRGIIVGLGFKPSSSREGVWQTIWLI